MKLLTYKLENLDQFPGFQPVVIPPQSIWRRLSRHETRFIKSHLRGIALLHVNFGTIAIDFQRYAAKVGVPMTVYFLGYDASAMLRDPEYCKKLKKIKFDAVFVNSEDMKKRLTPFLHSESESHVVYCGIPLQRFPFRQRYKISNGATFLQISRLDHKKGIDITIKAFKRYVKEYDPKAKLIIAGDGPLKEELINLTTSLDLEGRVNFTGQVVYEQYIKLLDMADVFIHPSVTTTKGDMEGIPNAIAEAMACGLPVISTNHSGIPELVKHGKEGFLVDEGDIDGLYSQMVRLKTEDIASVSENARKKIEEKFDQEKSSRLLCGHMNRIINGRG